MIRTWARQAPSGCFWTAWDRMGRSPPETIVGQLIHSVGSLYFNSKSHLPAQSPGGMCPSTPDQGSWGGWDSLYFDCDNAIWRLWMSTYCLHLRNPALPLSPQRGQFGSWRKRLTWQQPKNWHLRIYTGINAQTLKKKYLPPPPSDQMHLMEKDFMRTSNTSLFFRKWVKKRKWWKMMKDKNRTLRLHWAHRLWLQHTATCKHHMWARESDITRYWFEEFSTSGWRPGPTIGSKQTGHWIRPTISSIATTPCGLQLSSWGIEANGRPQGQQQSTHRITCCTSGGRCRRSSTSSRCRRSSSKPWLLFRGLHDLSSPRSKTEWCISTFSLTVFATVWHVDLCSKSVHGFVPTSSDILPQKSKSLLGPLLQN